MAKHSVLVGETKLTADIDDPERADWRAFVAENPGLHEEDVRVVMIEQNGMAGRASRARVVPGGPYQPTVLEGLEPFS